MDQHPFPSLDEHRLEHLTKMVEGLVARVETLQTESTQIRSELAENTAITKHIRDVGAFVRVGTQVLKWVGVIALAIGSLVAGWKMVQSGHSPTQIGPGP